MFQKNKNIILGIGDIHGKNTWESIIKKEDVSRVIFLGDYFDSFNIPFQEQWDNFQNILTYKRDNPKKVVLLFGNHDYHYLIDTHEHYSGYQPEHKNQIAAMFELELQNNMFDMCYVYNDFLVSHAGVTKTWYDSNVKNKTKNIRDDINNLFKTNPEAFKFTPSNPFDNTGDSITQSPIWVRPRALLSDKVDGFIQIVGHTHQEHIKINEEVIFVDSLEYGNEYLIINKNVPEIGTIEDSYGKGNYGHNLYK